MIRIADLIRQDSIIIDLRIADKLEALYAVVRFSCSVNGLDCVDEAVGKIMEREEDFSTGIGYGIAIPHARIDDIDRLYMVAARSVEGIEFDSIDGIAVKLIFMLFSPAGSPDEHTEVLSTLSRILSYEEVRRSLSQAVTPEEFRGVLSEAEEKYVGE